jgi:hypothetical protein
MLQPTGSMDVYPVASLAKSEWPSTSLSHTYHDNSVVLVHELAEAAAKVLDEHEAYHCNILYI